MTKKMMERKAADNEYFHRDFHISIDRGIRYIGETFGTEAVEAFLVRFAKNYYSPLAEAMKKDGLSAMKAHLESVYKTEKAPENIKCTLGERTLSVKVSACPAIRYMRESGYEPSEWNPLLSTLVYKVIAEEAGYAFIAEAYDEETGKAHFRFTKQEGKA